MTVNDEEAGHIGRGQQHFTEMRGKGGFAAAARRVDWVLYALCGESRSTLISAYQVQCPF